MKILKSKFELKNKPPFIFWIIFGIVILLSGIAIWKKWSFNYKIIFNTNENSVLFETKEWNELAGKYPGGFSLRITFDNNENLLLKHNNKDIVYKYDPAIKQLQLANEKTWATATGGIVNCNSQIGKEPLQIRIDGKTNKLLIDDKEVPNIKGRVHLQYRFTSGGDKFAILSASGKKASSLLPFLGEGGASGIHYHQVFSFPELVPIGSAIELPFTTEEATYRGCWSSGEKFIVYFHVLNFNLAIVDVRQ